MNDKLAEKIIQRALRLLKRRGSPVSVYLVDNPTIKKLNRLYRRRNAVTDVLAFPEPKNFKQPPGFKSRPLGEIYLALDYIRAKRESPVYLLIHGLLHLLHYDHGKNRDRIKMEQKEKWLMGKLK